MESFCYFVCLILSSSFVCCGTNANPRNIAVVAGQRMEMKCRNDEKYVFRSWQMHRVSDELEKMIFRYNGQDSYFPQYGIDHHSPGSTTLYSNQTLSSDAGVYRCSTLDYDTLDLVTFSAQLIVFESDPYCETSPESLETIKKGDSVSIQCSFQYKGNMAPDIEWRQFESDRSSSGQMVTHDVKTSGEGRVTSTLSIVTDFSTPRIFTFKTFFSHSANFVGSSSSAAAAAATNAPDYAYTWNSPPIGPSPAILTSSAIAPSSDDAKTSPRETNESETEFSLNTPASVVSATGKSEPPKLQFVFEHWILICACLGVALLASFIVAAVISYSRCVRVKRQAAARKVIGTAMPNPETNVEMQRSSDNYSAINDEVVYNEITVIPRPMLAQRSQSSSGYARELPRPPPLSQPIQNPIYYGQYPRNVDRSTKNHWGNTMGGQSKEIPRQCNEFTLASPLSTSLPTIYQEGSTRAPENPLNCTSVPENPLNSTRAPENPLNSTRVPVSKAKPSNKEKCARDPQSSPYLAAKDIAVEEDSEVIPSTYLIFNEQSKRNV